MHFVLRRLDPKTQNTQKHKENQDIHKGVGRRRRPTPLWRRPKAASLIFLVFLCILGFGVESTYKKLHIISGKHAQELYVDFYMPPKASEGLRVVCIGATPFCEKVVAAQAAGSRI